MNYYRNWPHRLARSAVIAALFLSTWNVYGQEAVRSSDAPPDKPYVVEWVYKIRWGHADEYWQRVGWHTFRHSHSTLLHSLGVDLKVQQQLLRHADIRTTMNIYTQAVPNALREANSTVVRLVIPAQVA
jgi:integrase